MFSRLNIARAAVPVGLASVASLQVALCSGEDHVPAIDWGWPHSGPFSSYDYASVRRGFQVYRQVCASCHSLDKIAFRTLVGVTHKEEDMKKIAESYDVTDGPNDQGEMFERPGKLSDIIPGPYKNEEAARAANNGAFPPDLSLVVKARHDGIDYIASLLTGYVPAPAGKNMLPGLYYNPYFPGGAIAMPKPLNDGQVDYEDGTIATESQMAKDVATFLAWAAEPEADERKKYGTQFFIGMVFAIAVTGFYKRFRWSIYKTQKISYTNKYDGMAGIKNKK